MKIALITAVLASLASCTVTVGDQFGSGSNLFDVEFVTIGDPGNAKDTLDGDGSSNVFRQLGSVDYTYRIAKYEISESMVDNANALGGLGITHDGRGAEKPATSISWLEAAAFANWLNVSSGYSPAYNFTGNGSLAYWAPGDAGYDPENILRNADAKYFLPDADEWYKAAYYDPSLDVYYLYPTGSNVPPSAVPSGTSSGTAVFSQPFSQGPADITQAGGLSPYGTMAQGGNVWEWEESSEDFIFGNISARRGNRGGNWNESGPGHTLQSLRGRNTPDFEGAGVGFRVASLLIIPEPTTLTLVLTATLFTASRSSVR